MKVKKYRGESMQEAIVKVKSDLGSDAIILHTRKFKKGGFFGLFTTKMVEVTATVDDNKDTKYLKEELNKMKGVMADLIGEIKEDKKRRVYSTVNSLINNLVESLWKIGFNRNTAKELAQKISNKIDNCNFDNGQLNKKLKELLQEELEGIISSIEPIEMESEKTKVVALTGPTGVGKTTTLAKLAAKFSLFEDKTVGLITADTYRIAAVEQLKTYSEIINLPLEVVFSPNELEDAIKGYEGYDLVLVDTAGRSQNNQVHVSELKGFISNSSIDEVYLVISATTKLTDLNKIIEIYNEINVDRLIITKVDETDSLGIIFEAVKKANKPLSYITVGQDVPEDIKLPEKDKLIEDISRELEL